MSLVELREVKGEGGAVSGGAMDRVIARKKIDKRILIGGAAGAILLLFLLFWMFAPRSGSQTVNPSRLTIVEAKQGIFEDFLPLRARVAPLVTVYLDAVEGGRVEELAVEDGATVVKGQLLAILSNADLQLSTLARQTEVEQQLTNMRSQELALQQTRSANRRELNQVITDLSKAQRLYDLQRPLADKGFVAAKIFNDTKDELEFQKNRLAILKRSIAEDEALQSNQLGQLRSSTASLNQSLSIARSSLSQLSLRAPVSGQLSGFSIQLGQSLQQGERLGQIDSAGRNKLEADVDEFYLGRVTVGQTASIELGGKTYGLKVSKIYPQVRNGQFRIDLVFEGPEPPQIQRGQTMSTKLTLGDASRALMIPNGAFFNDTGGNWIFVVSGNGKSAERRPVQLGRRNNDFIEVLDGLKPGERVITSTYSGLVDKDHLSFDTDE
jgi:HlyD family secretion protein